MREGRRRRKGGAQNVGCSAGRAGIGLVVIVVVVVVVVFLFIGSANIGEGNSEVSQMIRSESAVSPFDRISVSDCGSVVLTVRDVSLCQKISCV